MVIEEGGGDVFEDSSQHRDSSPACRGLHAGAGKCLKGTMIPWEAHAQTGSWQDLWPWEGEKPRMQHFQWQDLWPHRTHGGAISFHVRDSYWNSSWRSATCVRDPTMEHRRTVRRKERQRQHWMNCLNLPFPSPHATEKSWVESRKKKGWGEGILKFVFISSYFILIWLVEN